jgi:hypothetical protein
VYREGTAVDENKEQVEPPPTDFSPPVSLSRLRVHHYRFKSEEEFIRKQALWRSAGRARPIPDFAFVEAIRNELDTTILPYVPPLRERLGLTEEHNSPALP